MLLLVNFDEQKIIEEIRKKRFRSVRERKNKLKDNRLNIDSSNLTNYRKRGLLCDVNEEAIFDVLEENQAHIHVSFLGLVWIHIIGVLRDKRRFNLPLHIIEIVKNEMVGRKNILYNFESLVFNAIKRIDTKIVIEFNKDGVKVSTPEPEECFSNHVIVISFNTIIRDYVLNLDVINNRGHLDEVGLFGILTEPELLCYYCLCEGSIVKLKFRDINNKEIVVPLENLNRIFLLNVILNNKYKEITYSTTDSEVTFKNKSLKNG